ncbi:DUF1837 domain-containing protein [Erwinia sp. 198]|uniref:HamA C-terminal domain-containing protein n=1 Tax=Erwinia sp. 198 TaxID=2022746 RepID=UPI000F6844BA|nr:DUF1837 domain-containing protein [Erwinia sp. 198]RRZ92349.1 DUF1837 domain-containing protein [Erwinia sp. 198]
MGDLKNINNYIEVKKQDFDSCIDVIEHDLKIDGIDATLRFHYIKFSGNGVPLINLLAEKLYEYIVQYCIASRNREGELTPQQYAQLIKQARKLFRHPIIDAKNPDQTGEAGEALLFFLMEAVLNAPQLVSKMELKTNSGDEVKGSDGIHVKWNEQENIVEFYFGESKLYQSISSAMDSALESIDNFHLKGMYKHEFNMVTKFFKYANDEIKSAITDLIVSGEPGENVRINHACLIGYNWSGFNKLSRTKELSLADCFIERFKADFPRIHGLINEKFSLFERKELKFEVFFIPFPSVSDFRNAFNKALD